MPVPLPRVLLLACALGLPQPSPRPTQPQVARRFLLEVLAADYQAAHHRLTPATRAALPLPAFARAVWPLWKQGQAHGQVIELYQVGAWLGTPPQPTEWFCRFRFAADSLAPLPRPLFEVTFRDTASRQVQGFRLRE